MSSKTLVANFASGSFKLHIPAQAKTISSIEGNIFIGIRFFRSSKIFSLSMAFQWSST